MECWLMRAHTCTTKNDKTTTPPCSTFEGNNARFILSGVVVGSLTGSPALSVREWRQQLAEDQGEGGKFMLGMIHAKIRGRFETKSQSEQSCRSKRSVCSC